MATTETRVAHDEAAFTEAFNTAQELERRLVVVSRQLGLLEDLLGDKRRAHDTVHAWLDAKEGDEVLVPIGGETFLPARVARPDLVIKGVGAGYAVERAPKRALEVLQKEIAALEKDTGALTESARRIETQIAQVNAYLERLQAKA